MTPAELKDSVASSRPSPGLSGPLQALWWAAKGDWARAHKLVMNDESSEAAWVHAYLHRVEGDLPNARYWYAVANKPTAEDSLEEEWTRLVAALTSAIN